MNYIALEGVDNCGKSTVIKKLKNDFPNFTYVREPGTTKYSEELRKVMFSNINVNQLAIQMAMTSARIDLASHLLKENKDVISDRCFLSLAYADGFNEETCRHLLETQKLFVPILPNIIIYLQISADESVKRFKGKMMEGYDTLDAYVVKHRIDRYEYLIDLVSELNISKVIKVNAERNPSLVYDEIRSIIYEYGGKTNSSSQDT